MTLSLASTATPIEPPDIILPEEYSDGFNTCSKRQRVGYDGKYSPCPSPSSSRSHSPFSDPGETSASSTPFPVQFCPPSPSFLSTPSTILGPNSKPDDYKTILDGLVSDLGTVFNPKTLKEVDQEVCFGMIPGKLVLTYQNLCLLQQSYAAIAHPPSFVPLDLEVDSAFNNKVQVTADIGPKNLMLGILEMSLSIALVSLLNPPLVRMQALMIPPFEFTKNLERCDRVRKRKTQQASTQKLNMVINIYGNQKYSTPVGRFLSKSDVFLQHPKFPEPGHLYKNPHFLSRPGALALVTEFTLTGGVTPIEVTSKETEMPTNTAELSKIFDGLWESETLCEHPGDWRLKIPLLRHQKQGLYFLMKRELNLSMFESYNPQSHCSIRGGILADYMGLGKTLTILSLVVGSLDEARATTINPQHPNHKNTSRRSGATLLIAPVSILGNWEDQIAAHSQPDTLKYYIYYGKDREVDPHILSGYDIIFTSFQTATQEWKAAQNSPSPSPLHSINWFRLILDEAHVIRTQKTSQFQAICALSAERRWCVTGTPLQNSITDIATIFKFLGCEPLNTAANFDRYVAAKLRSGDNDGMKTLRAMLKLVCLRRTKDTISGSLPTRREETKYLEFSTEEKTLYSSHKQKLSCNFVKTQHTTKENTFQVLLSLRLICNHGKDLLQQKELEFVCSDCGEQLRDWKMEFEGQIPCVHRALCRSCIYNLEMVDNKEVDNTLDLGCQLCFTSQNMFGSSVQTAFPNYQGPSTKVKALIESIHQCASEDLAASVNPPSKHVVFSSWTKMLDLVQIALKNNGILFCRLDGSMSRSQRNQTLKGFAANPHIIVILVSLMAGGVGINLTCASRVHLLEPHWNPMVEQQAVERVHRLGQTRDVVITRYIMNNSFETDMLNFQKKKLELARQSLDTKMAVQAAEDVIMT